jgi:hypothetical protein
MSDLHARLRSILSTDHRRMWILDLVRSLRQPDCWVAAGFVRAAVWDHLHVLPPSLPDTDVDVIWFDPDHAQPADDRALQDRLASMDPSIDWSVKNQSRMHVRNGDQPYSSATQALEFWPETATAVAVRQTRQDTIEIAAPFGLDDLFDLVIRPTPHFTGAKHLIYLGRLENKQWLRRWPRLTVSHTTGANDGSRNCIGQLGGGSGIVELQ